MKINPTWQYFRKNTMEVTLEDMYKSIDKLKEMRDNVEKDDAKLGLPNIPMGKNSHTKTKEGYVYNKTKIMVQDAVKSDLAVNLLQKRVQSMWNTLPDDVRDLVNTLLIKKSTSRARGGGKRQGGRWQADTKTIYMNIHERDRDVEHSFYHEVGHAKWSKLKENNPEKIKKFREQQENIGQAPTDYSQSYLMVKEKNEDNEKRYRDNMKRAGHTIPERDIKILDKNRRNAEDLFHNEIHSELNAYAMGSLPEKYLTAPKKQIGELLNSYKEMWDL